MTTFRRGFDRLGGPEAVTWTAFWVSLTASLLGSIGTGGDPLLSLPARIAAVLVSQLAMFVPLALLRVSLLRSRKQRRPVLAVTGFALAVIIRGLVLAMMIEHLTGSDPRLAFRLVSGGIPAFLVLLLCNLAMSSLSEHRSQRAALLALTSQLDSSRQAVEGLLCERNDRSVAFVRAELVNELSRLGHQPADTAVQGLQRLATDIVRPLSHDLADSLPTWRPEPVDPMSLRIPWSSVVSETLAGRPFRPFLVAALAAVLVVLSRLGSGQLSEAMVWAVITVVSVAALLLLGNVLLGRAPTGRNPWLRLCGWLAYAALTGGLVGTAIEAISGSPSNGPSFTALGMLYATILAALTTMASVLQAHQRQIDATLESAASEMYRELALIHQVQWFQQQALSRALHGSVQSAVIAAARRLEESAQDHVTTAEECAAVRADLLEVLDVLASGEAPSIELPEAVDRIASTWRGICALDVVADSRASELIKGDPVARACIIDVITEATSNAVRHGGADEVLIEARGLEREVELRVASNVVTSSEDNGPGLGTRLLDECSLAWDRQVSSHQQMLSVTFPIRESASADGVA